MPELFSIVNKQMIICQDTRKFNLLKSRSNSICNVLCAAIKSPEAIWEGEGSGETRKKREKKRFALRRLFADSKNRRS